jgi:hypothetical protein
MSNHAVTRFVVACAVAGLFVAAAAARAVEPPLPLTIVVNEHVAPKAINKEDLRNLYLGKTSFWPGNVKVVAYDRPVERGAGQAFYRDVLKMVPARFRHHWQSRQLSGQGAAPEALAAADDVIAHVAATAGAIAYLHSDEVPKVVPKGVVFLTVTPEE